MTAAKRENLLLEIIRTRLKMKWITIMTDINGWYSQSHLEYCVLYWPTSSMILTGRKSWSQYHLESVLDDLQ